MPMNAMTIANRKQMIMNVFPKIWNRNKGILIAFVRICYQKTFLGFCTVPNREGFLMTNEYKNILKKTNT